jgi:hypothetical protein
MWMLAAFDGSRDKVLALLDTPGAVQRVAHSDMAMVKRQECL